MPNYISRLSPFACFLVMPALIALLIAAFTLNLVTADTETPEVLGAIFRWRTSNATFVSSLAIGCAICMAVMLYSNRFASRNGPGLRAQRLFHAATIFLANNFYFWSGNFITYTLASIF
ncbi:hypothetical protein ACUS6C_04160 [Pseudomonas aeruginosa]